jgi:response regulator of citrate/malate metabolism
MAYREVDVLEVKEVLRRWFAGAGKKQIARELGLSRTTVRRYLRWAEDPVCQHEVRHRLPPI